jgi:hypothetical protein
LLLYSVRVSKRLTWFESRKMSWEEHVSYLTFLANYAITNGSSEPFTRYCLLTTAPKNNIRLIKTPLNKRNLSFFEIFQIDMSLAVGSLPILIRLTGLLLDESNPSAAVANFLTTSDLVYLKQALESEPYNKLPSPSLSGLFTRSPQWKCDWTIANYNYWRVSSGA